MLPLLGSHPLDLLHAAASATGAIGKALDTVGKLVMEFFDQTSNGADRVPQQGPIGRVMNVGFHYRGVDAEFLAVFQTELDGRLNYGFWLIASSVAGVSRLKARLKASCLGTSWVSNCVKPRSV